MAIPDPPFLRTASLSGTLGLLCRFGASALGFPVLLLGERGSGKTVFAHVLHEAAEGKPTRVRTRPFEAINAAEIPYGHEQSFLFGHSRGAFTDSKADRAGALVRANGGTLFIDELHCLSLAAQDHLLTSLTTGAFNRMGDDRPTRSSFRLVAATNRHPHELVREGKLHRELLDRIGPCHVRVPPLRERQPDVLPLSRHFLAHVAAFDGKGHNYTLTAAAERLLLEQEWPGNVRMLWNAVAGATIYADSPSIDVPELQASLGPMLPEDSLTIEQRCAIALVETGGNRTRAARVAGVSRRTVQRYSRDKPV